MAKALVKLTNRTYSMPCYFSMNTAESRFTSVNARFQPILLAATNNQERVFSSLSSCAPLIVWTHTGAFFHLPHSYEDGVGLRSCS